MSSPFMFTLTAICQVNHVSCDQMNVYCTSFQFLVFTVSFRFRSEYNFFSIFTRKFSLTQFHYLYAFDKNIEFQREKSLKLSLNIYRNIAK